MTTAVAGNDSGQRVESASFRVLLALFLVVPLCLVVAQIDALTGGALRRTLPAHPDQIVLFTLLFNVPHVVASHLLLFGDGAYRRLYARWIVVAVVITMSTLLVAGLWLGPHVQLVLAIAITMWHVLGQQAGMTGAILRPRGFAFPAWKYCIVASGVAVFLGHPDYAVALGRANHALVANVGSALWVPAAVLAAVLSRRAPSALSLGYLWANQLLVLSMIALLRWGYPLFAVLAVRFVHDATAFYVYSVHDRNRNRAQPINSVHRVLSRLRVPSGAVTLVAALLVACLITRALPRAANLFVVAFISMMHYVLEAVTWRRGSPHRAHLAFNA